MGQDRRLSEEKMRVTFHPLTVHRAIEAIKPSLRQMEADSLTFFVVPSVHALLDIPRLQMEVSQMVDQIALSELRTLALGLQRPLEIYLLDPTFFSKMKISSNIYYCDNYLLVNCASLIYALSKEKLRELVKRGVAYHIFSDGLVADYPILPAGIASYFVHREKVWYEMVAYQQVFGFPAMTELAKEQTIHKIDLYNTAVFCLVLDRLGVQGLKELLNFLTLNRRRYLKFILLYPTLGWSLESLLNVSGEELNHLWEQILARKREMLDTHVLSQHVKRFQLDFLLRSRSLNACVDLCQELLDKNLYKEEVVFILAYAYTLLGEYRKAIASLSRYINELPRIAQGWVHLYIGRLYAILRETNQAQVHYQAAQELSDPWGIISGQAEKSIHHHSLGEPATLVQPPFERSHEIKTDYLCTTKKSAQQYILKLSYAVRPD